MIFRQLTHDDLGCASYLIGDEDAGVAAVVDPKLDIDEYLRLARYLGVRIEHILETHNHADHVSGHGRLAAATGATIHIHRDAAPDYDHEPFDDGWELELGSVRVRAIHTPGHRPEHTAFALIDTEHSFDPVWALELGLDPATLLISRPTNAEQGIGVLAGLEGDWDKAGAYYEESLALFRQLGDRRRGFGQLGGDVIVVIDVVGRRTRQLDRRGGDEVVDGDRGNACLCLRYRLGVCPQGEAHRRAASRVPGSVHGGGENG